MCFVTTDPILYTVQCESKQLMTAMHMYTEKITDMALLENPIQNFNFKSKMIYCRYVYS